MCVCVYICIYIYSPLKRKKILICAASLMAQWVKNLPAVQKTQETCSFPGLGRSPGGGNGTHSSILAWKILWTEEASGLQSMGLPTVGHWVTMLAYPTWINLKDILLSRTSSYKVTNTVWFHLYETLNIVKNIQTDNRMVVVGSWEDNSMKNY